MSVTENTVRLMERKRTAGPVIRVSADVLAEWGHPAELVVDRVETEDGCTEVRIRSE